MNIDSYNHQLQQNQKQPMQQQQPPFYSDSNYMTSHASPDASMVPQPPINPSSYPNPNQLAQSVNKMSLQDEQYHPNSQFAPPLRPEERNGSNGFAYGDHNSRPDQRFGYTGAAGIPTQMAALSQSQFKRNANFPPSFPPAAGSMTGASYPTSAQNGVSHLAPSFDSTPSELSVPGQQFAPPSHQIAPPGPQIAPPGSQIAPPGPKIAPPSHQIAPPGHQIAPSSHQIAPPGHQIAPPGHQIAPPGHQVAPFSQAAPPRTNSFGPPRPSSASAFSPVAAPSPAATPLNYPSMGMAAPPQQMQPPPTSMQPPFQRSAYPPSFPPQKSGGPYPPPHGFPPTAGAPAPHMPGRGFENHAGESAPYPQPPMAGHPSAASSYNHVQPGMQPAMQSQYQRKLDPDQMPNPIQVMQEDQELRGAEPFITNQPGAVPPLVTTSFIVQDEGNANPRFMRSTMYSVPCAIDMMKQADIPFSLVITPFATLAPEEEPPQVVNTGDLGPVRCVRCKAYINSFVKFIDGGRRFVCALCSAVTEVPTQYFQHLDHTGNRVDRFERPELLFGAYEFTVNKDYCKDGEIPNIPAFIFIIDVSYNNVKSGLVRLLCENLVDIIQNHLPTDERASESHAGRRIRVGFITYDTTVHFYNIKACLGQSQMMIVGDMEDMFVPLVDGFLCDPIESQVVIDSLMQQIPNTFAETRETDTILLPAVRAGLEALKAAKCAGKLLLFHSSLPTGNAPGKLANREDRKLLATEKEKTVLTPQNTSYSSLAQECVNNGCSVDLYVLNNSHVDLATIGQLPKVTGGEIFKYTYFQADVDGDRLLNDVRHNLERQIAFDAVMRVRTSTGVRPIGFFGHFHMSNTTDIELASVNADKSVAVEIKHDDKLNEEDLVFVQVAILFTSCFGERRVRILNLSLRTCTQLADLYRSCELDTLVNYWSKAAVVKLMEGTPRQVRESLISRSVRILACYRKLCANPSSPGQLILPECMKLLPLYVNCLLKSDAISGGSDMAVDDRYFMMQAVNIMDIPSSVNYFYPRLLPLVLVDLASDEIPSPIRCTSYKLSSSEAYLLENGIYMFLWLGSKLPNEWIAHVFGVPDLAQIGSNIFKLPEFDNAYSKKIHSLITHVQNERRRVMKLTIVREHDKMEIVFRRFLVEDGTPGVATGGDNFAHAPYVDFLCQMHKEIRNTLS